MSMRRTPPGAVPVPERSGPGRTISPAEATGPAERVFGAAASSPAGAEAPGPPGPPVYRPANTDRRQYLCEVISQLWPAPARAELSGVAPDGSPLAAQSLTAGGAADHPAGDAGITAAAGGEPGGTDSEFLLLLGTRRPRLLVPAVPAAAATAVRGYGQPRSRAGRVGAATLARLLASPAGSAAIRSRVRVHTPPGADTIESFLARVLGREVLVSLYLGAARANRKPVLQLLSPGGEPIGFAKIGVNPLTRALVQAERDGLAQLAQAQLHDVTVPQVLHYGDWRDRNVLVLGALPVWQRHQPVTTQRLAAAMAAVASVGGHQRGPLAASSYWRALTSRLAAADESPARDELQGALAALADRSGRTPVSLGSWHGDWTPWNMASTRSGLLVWDWERFTGGVPVGFDALHYRLQQEMAAGHATRREAADDCITAAPKLLAPFGIDPGEATLTGVLYLADLATRYLADRQAEAGARNGTAGSWLIPAVLAEVTGARGAGDTGAGDHAARR